MTHADLQPYAGLSPDTLLDAVESLGFVTDARLLALNSYENRVYQVGLEEKPPLIAKFYRPGRWSNAAILEEHDFTQALAAAEMPVVAPWRDAEGRSLFTYRGFRFALFTRRGGHAPELERPDHLYSLGLTLGRIHALGATADFVHRPTLDSQTLGHASVDYLLGHDWIPPSQTSEYRALTQDLLAAVDERFRSSSAQRRIRLHGDCHPGNILWRDGGPHFVDFDDCRAGPEIQDLWMLLSGDRQQQALQLNSLLEGYETFHVFDPAQLALVEPLRALRILSYAAWLARRWEDPAFPLHFPWFDTPAYWLEHLLELRELLRVLEQPHVEVPLW